jgi:hypothetical protein
MTFFFFSLSARLSWQSTASTESTDSAAYLRNLDLVLPPSPSNKSHYSKNSINSLLTDNSADAIFPRTILVSTSQPSSPTRIRDRVQSSPIPEDVTLDTAVDNHLPSKSDVQEPFLRVLNLNV